MKIIEAANKSKVESMLEAWKNGDGGALQSLLSDDIVWTITGNSAAAGTTHGRQDLTANILQPFGARFAQSPDLFRPREIKGVYADGNTVIAHFTASGTTNNGRTYENDYVWILDMQNGLVTRATAFFDSIAFDAMWQRQPASPN